MKQYQLIAFDVDGTLVETRSGAAFRKSADDWQWMPGRLARLETLKAQGARRAVCSNQGGVAFGYMAARDIAQEMSRMAREGDIPIGGIYLCYTHPKASIDQYRDAEDERRKPGPGMLLEAMRDFEAEPEETLFVGDRPEDEEAARRAGVDFQWAKDYFGE